MWGNSEIKLEKTPDAKLDATDKAIVNSLDKKVLANKLQEIKDERFDLNSKNKGVRLDDIVKNYNTSTHTIDLKWEKIPVVRESDLAGWIQILLVAAGKNIKSVTDKTQLWIDWKIKRNDGVQSITSIAIEDYKGQNENNSKNGQVTEGLPENVLDDVAMREYISGKNIYNITTNQLWKSDADSFKNYKITGPNWKFLNALGLNNKLTINYTSPQSKNFQRIVIDYKNITAKDWSVDNAKLINTIKDSLLKNEANLTAKAWKESVWDWVEDVQVKAFSPFMQEYIKTQWRQAMNWEIDFNPWTINNSGMEVSNGFVTVSFPWHVNISWRLSDMQTSNKFDQNKFVAKISERITPRAQTWKWEQLAKAYKDLPKNQAISSIENATSIDTYINKYKNLKKDMDSYAKEWVKVDAAIKNDVPVKIENLTNQKNYVTAKNWIEQDIKSFEKRNKEEMSRSEMKALEKEMQGRVSQLLAWTTYLTTSKILVKDAFTKNKKSTEYDAYVKRYQALL